MWKKAYFDTRAKIEASGREARWEFDRKRLFQRTDYMAVICQDLYDILQVGRLERVFFKVCKGDGSRNSPDGKQFGFLLTFISIYLANCFAYKLTTGKAHCCRMMGEERESNARILLKGKGHTRAAVWKLLPPPTPVGPIPLEQSQGFQSPLVSCSPHPCYQASFQATHLPK